MAQRVRKLPKNSSVSRWYSSVNPRRAWSSARSADLRLRPPAKPKARMQRATARTWERTSTRSTSLLRTTTAPVEPTTNPCEGAAGQYIGRRYMKGANTCEGAPHASDKQANPCEGAAGQIHACSTWRTKDLPAMPATHTYVGFGMKLRGSAWPRESSPRSTSPLTCLPAAPCAEKNHVRPNFDFFEVEY